MMTRPELADRAREVREKAGLSQTELSNRINVDRSAISKAENFESGDGFTSLRKRIIESLTGADVEGPFYREDD